MVQSNKKTQKVLSLLIFCFVFLLINGLTSCKSTKLAYHNDAKIINDYESSHCKKNSYSSSLIKEAYSWIGTPYKYAAAEKGCGTDCSGMVMKVYQSAVGYTLPRNSEKQAEFCLPVNSDEVQSGDLVFFATGSDPNKVSHVGIMVDNILFIHASSSKGVVESKMTNPYFSSKFLMFGRVPAPAASR
ncbi:MAG: C40 family peptidase [Prevotella sp.]|nr:C40 family peptidase [Bacteroides sp.]MCM1365881.1 C40 family peptidase [Prevotella sp.]